jgi:hypothetical protein
VHFLTRWLKKNTTPSMRKSRWTHGPCDNTSPFVNIPISSMQAQYHVCNFKGRRQTCLGWSLLVITIAYFKDIRQHQKSNMPQNMTLKSNTKDTDMCIFDNFLANLWNLTHTKLAKKNTSIHTHILKIVTQCDMQLKNFALNTKLENSGRNRQKIFNWKCLTWKQYIWPQVN